MLDSIVRAQEPKKHAFILTHRPTTTERMSGAEGLARFRSDLARAAAEKSLRSAYKFSCETVLANLQL